MSNQSCSCQPTPQSQQHGSERTTATYTTAHSNARSFIHCVRPGIQLPSSWMLVGFVSTVPQWELRILLFLIATEMKKKFRQADTLLSLENTPYYNFNHQKQERSSNAFKSSRATPENRKLFCSQGLKIKGQSVTFPPPILPSLHVLPVRKTN